MLPYGKAGGAKDLAVFVFSGDKPVICAEGKLSLVNESPEKDITRGQFCLVLFV